MCSSVQLYLIAGVLAYLAHSAYGVSCYSCESDTNPNCGEVFDDDGVPTVDCSNELLPRYLAAYNPHLKPTGCKKLILESFEGVQKIERFCYYGSLNDTNQGCRRDPSYQGKTIKCEVCNDDLCNSSDIIYSKNLILSLLFTICGLMYVF